MMDPLSEDMTRLREWEAGAKLVGTANNTVKVGV